MRRLILLRHAKTERRAESGEDFDRALTERGRTAAAAAGHALARAGLVPDVALVSASRRTRETFELMRPCLPDVREEVTRALYDASAETLHEVAQACGGNTVLIIAHNPGVHSLALALAEACAVIGVEERTALEAGFPPAAAAAFEFVDGRTACLGVFQPAQAT